MARPELISGNVFIRPNLLTSVGKRIDGHRHNFDHTTIVFTGAVHVRATQPDGRVIERDYEAPSHFLVRAEVEHEITAIESHEHRAIGALLAEKDPVKIRGFLERKYSDTSSEPWCVYSHRDPQGRITQEYTGWEEAYR